MKNTPVTQNAWDVDIEQAKRTLDQLRSRHKNFMYLSAGDTNIRILPPRGIGLPWFKDYGQHYNVRTDGKPIFCAKVCFDEPCYICEHVQDLRASENPTDQKTADSLSVATRIFLAVIDMGDQASGPRILECPPTVLEGILGFFVDSRWGQPLNPNKGCLFIITKSGSGKTGTRYSVKALPDQAALPNMAVLNNIPDLEKGVAERLSYGEVKAMITGENELVDANAIDVPPAALPEITPPSVGNAQAVPSNVGNTQSAPSNVGNAQSAPSNVGNVSGQCPLGTFGKFNAEVPACVTCADMAACVTEMATCAGGK